MRRALARFVLAVIAIASLWTTGQLAFAQGAADLSGLIKDSSGATVPGATVTVRNLATNQTREARSDAQGRYACPNLPIGRHEITARAEGFQPTLVSIELSIGQKAEQDITLTVGGISESVYVSAAGERLAVQTETSTYGQLVSPRQIDTLPLNGRDFTQLVLLQPGTVQARSDQGDILTGKGPKVSIHGARTSQNIYMLDGADILDALGRTAAGAQGFVSGIESVQEFTVLINTYSAEYGRASGGVFNIATRSGTNEFHGTAFEYLRNSALDAANFFENASHVTKAPFKRNQFGLSAGGPLRRDRLFIFGAYEGFRESLGITNVQPVPSLAARRGAFLPSGVTINPAMLPYLAVIPLPTIDPNPSDPTGRTGLFAGQFKQPSRVNSYNARLDYHLSPADTLFARYTQNDSRITFLSAENFPDFPNTGTNFQKFFTLGATRVFRRDIVNGFRYSFNRTTPSEKPTPPNGFPNLAFVPGQIVGDFFISGFKRFGSDRNTPRSFFQNTNQISDDFSLVRGAHAMKLGTNLERFAILGISSSRDRGEFTINTFSDFLRGTSANFVGLAPGANDQTRRHGQWLLGFYFQDDWKVRPNLTLNLGLRYEFITTPTERDGKVTNVRTPSDSRATLGDPLFENPSKKNFAPRVGFAYSPNFQKGFLSKLTGGQGKTAVRGGFGLYYDQLLYSIYGNMTFKHEPFFKQIRINNAPIPNIFSLLSGGVGQIDTFAMEFKPRPTYVMQFNLNLQREISSKLLVTAAYVGSRGIHLWRESDWNIAIPLNPPVNTLFPPVPNPRRRNPNFANIRFKTADAQSFYNAFQLGVLSRIGRDFQAQLSYTLAKSVDDQSSSLGRNEFSNGQARTVDPMNKKLNRGLSDFDVRHSLALNFSYELPFGPARRFASQATGVMRWLSDGWQLNGILTAVSGIPVTPIITFDQDRDGTLDNEQRPDLAPGVTRIPTRLSKTQLFDPRVFVLPPIGRRGSLGRNIITGPGLFTVDIAMGKYFYVSSDHARSIQFRAEFFNAFNRANFAIPEIGNLTVFNSPTQRNSTAGQITRTSTSSRQIQFSLRLAF